MRVPAAFVAVPLLAGASVGILFCESTPDRLTLASAAAAVLCLLAGIGCFADDDPSALIVCLVVGAACAGYSSGRSAARELLRPSLLRWFDALGQTAGEPVVVEGVLRDDASTVAYGVVMAIDAASVSVAGSPARAVDGGIRLVVSGAPSSAIVAQWRAGRTVRAPTVLRRPMTFSNPDVPDEQRALALRGIALNGSVKSAALVEIESIGGWMTERAAEVRASVRQTIGRYVGGHDPRSSAVATAILIGDRTGLSEDDARRLQDAGTYHVIAISGGNIAILTVLVIFAARALRVPHRASAAAGIVLLLFYGEIAGGGPSVSRAITVAIIVLTATILDHRGSPLNVLAVAGMLAVGVRPQTMIDGGFLLSFGATVGIILGMPWIAALSCNRGGHIWVRATRRLLTFATGLVVATICAELVLIPIGASLFSRVTFAGLVLNFAAIPLMTAVQCGSMALVLAASTCRPAAEMLGQLIHHSAWALVESSRLVERAPWLVREVTPPSWWLCGIYYTTCVALLLASRHRRVLGAVLVAAVAMVVTGSGSAVPAVPPQTPLVLRVAVLDVGQGDATVAVLPDGRAILVDAGGLAGTTFDMGTRVIVPALRALGVRHLHALVLTHGDPDHVGGAEVVMRRLGAANVWEGIPVPPHPRLRLLRELAATQRVVWRTIRPGDEERAGGIRVRVLHPPAPDWERQRVRNDDSVVLELRYGGVSILLPGDIGRDVETRLLPTLDLAPLVILKAAHHGSATSSSELFIEKLNPRAVVFSTGRNNRFGHPAKVVVERFESRGVEMFNTATDGAVFVETDGVSVEIYGWQTGRRLRVH